MKLQIQNDMKDAMRAKEAFKLLTIRMLLAAIKQVEVDTRTTLEDPDVLSIINKMIKQRQEAATQYVAAQRLELADKENEEIKILQAYLPAQLDDQAIEQLIAAAITNVAAKTVKDMGAVMTILKPQLTGRADMGKVSLKVKEKLA